MNWLIAAGVIILLLFAADRFLRLLADLAAITVMIIGGAIKLLISPFRHRH